MSIKNSKARTEYWKNIPKEVKKAKMAHLATLKWSKMTSKQRLQHIELMVQKRLKKEV